MAIDPSISLGVKTPDLTGTLGSLTQLSAQRLALQKARDTYDADVAGTKAASQSLQAGAQVDTANVQPRIDQQAAITSQAQTGAQSAGIDLTNKVHQQVIDDMTGLIGSPTIRDATDTAAMRKELDLAKTNSINYGTPAAAVNQGMQPVYDALDKDPKTVQPMLVNMLRMSLRSSGQPDAIAPSGVAVSNGQTGSVINTNQLSGLPVGAPIPGTTQQQQLPPTAVAFNPNTNAQQYVGAGGRGGPQAGPGLGVPEQIAQNQAEVAQVRAAGDQAPVQRNINQQILKLSRNTDSGPGTPTWQKGLGVVSLGQFGDNYQELGKYLEKNAIANMTSMGGPPSDARLSAAAAANGSTSFNPGALQEVTKFNDATTTAVDKYRQGVDKAVGLRNGDVNALPAFKAAWAQNLDPNVFRAENAIRDNDTQELQRLKTELGSNGLKALAQKRQNLESLSSSGHLPQ